MVIRAHANIERDRRGDRSVESTEVLAVLEQEEDRYLPTDRNNEYDEYIMAESSDIIFKTERHEIFSHWLIETYGKKRLSQGSGTIDLAGGGNGMISHTLTDMGICSTLLDPNPRYDNHSEINKANGDEHTTRPPLGVIPHPWNGDGTDLISRHDNIGTTISN